VQVWRKTVLRKWLNIRSSESDFSADEGDTADEADSESEYEGAPSSPTLLLPPPIPSPPVPSSMNCLATPSAVKFIFVPIMKSINT
jgi:hypothetical protein